MVLLFGPPDSPDVADRLRQGQQAAEALLDYFRTLAARRRAQPENDLISTLVAAADRGDGLSEEELMWNCLLLLLGGFETTTDLIGNGLLALLRHPGEMRKVLDDPSLIPAAVEEMLRYDTPFQFVQRQTKEDVVVGGVAIVAGQAVWLMLAAANRDPAMFADPDRFDVTRRPHRHLAFGEGAHFCPGGSALPPGSPDRLHRAVAAPA